MKVGVFFGGPSREREISFAGGRTVYDNLNKSIFEPIPIFVDSLGKLILLDWKFIYKGTIRDFYPYPDLSPASKNPFQIYIESLSYLSKEELEKHAKAVGKPISPEDLPSLIDFAFLTLHGPYGEDGNLQGLLEWYDIPYSGAGILPSAIGVNKIIQKDLMQKAGFPVPKHCHLTAELWDATENKAFLYEEIKQKVGFPLVVKSPNQGSSIGVSVLNTDDLDAFIKAVEKSLFRTRISKNSWEQMNHETQRAYLFQLLDIREGIGMPLYLDGELLFHPDELWDRLNQVFAESQEEVLLQPLNTEEEILFEEKIEGREFSCIVISDENGNPKALPPTEIIKGQDLFDYRSKYLPGMSRKLTPIRVEKAHLIEIRRACEALYSALHCDVYARIDGFITASGEIFLNDPNTTSGMLPSSFFFHQAAEIGLNPSQFLSYIIRTSLLARIKNGKKNHKNRLMLGQLDQQLEAQQNAASEKIRVAVVMGGFSSERHISVESGRNIYEKLASSTKYHPIPVFLTGSESNHLLYEMPVNIMLKDNADDIKEKLSHTMPTAQQEILEEIRADFEGITQKYSIGDALQFKQLNYDQLAEMVDVVFIALHGRPGEDGAIQAELERVGLPYNGSGIESSQVTINKYETNEILGKNGISVAKHRLVWMHDWQDNAQGLVESIEQEFTYPFIAKPADDGCSSAVKKIKNREELQAFTRMMFRQQEAFLSAEAGILKLKSNEEFPQKQFFLIEELISANGATHFLEVTGGLLTHWENGEKRYEIFEASETLASGEVLSLEEKFLAGEGQNITPARYTPEKSNHAHISNQVKHILEKVARILNIEGYARIDAFVRVFEDGKAETIIIEVNSLPGMTPATCIFHQSAINGYKPYHFIDAILTYGMQKQNNALIE